MAFLGFSLASPWNVPTLSILCSALSWPALPQCLWGAGLGHLLRELHCGIPVYPSKDLSPTSTVSTGFPDYPGTTTPTLSPLSHTPCVTLSSLFIRQLSHYILWTCEFLQARSHLIHLWGPVPWRWPPYHSLSVEFLDFISQKMSSCWKIFSTTQSKQYSKRISGYT